MEKKKNNLKLRLILFAIIGVILLQLWILFGKFTGSSEVEELELPSATIIDIPVNLPEFTLINHNGKEFTRRDLFGKWTFVFFGYIHCPDVCPMALVDLNDVYTRLAEQGKLIEAEYKVPTQVLFVSVDPERDTVEELKEYVPYFNKDFIGLTGKKEVIDSVAGPMGVGYRKVPVKDEEEDYLVDHTASFMLLDPLGGMRAIFSPPHEPEQITEDFLNIRQEFTAECCLALEQEVKETVLDYKKENK